MNIVWSIVRDPKEKEEEEEERVHLLQNKNTIITNATIHDSKGNYQSFEKSHTNEKETSNSIL